MAEEIRKIPGFESEQSAEPNSNESPESEQTESLEASSLETLNENNLDQQDLNDTPTEEEVVDPSNLSIESALEPKSGVTASDSIASESNDEVLSERLLADSKELETATEARKLLNDILGTTETKN